jgi:putative transposase
VVIAGANVHDAKLLAATLDAVIVERPEPSDEAPQHLCLDQGYHNPTGRAAATERDYITHFTRSGQPAPAEAPHHPARRWVVERTLAWLSKCRALLVRWDKKASNYLALIKLACALLWYRRRHRLTVLR